MNPPMDQHSAPLLEGLAEYHRLGRYGFTPPGHRQGRGVDSRTKEVLGEEPFRADVLATGGLDDRKSSEKLLARAEALMAEAVGAQHAFFSTCGSSLSVKAAMLAVSGGTHDLLVGRDAHKSVTAGLIFAGVQPRWVQPRWDADLHLAHPPSPEQVAEVWEQHPDAAGALIVSPTPYGTCADIEGIAKVCHERVKPLIVDEAWGAHLPFNDDLPTWAMNAGADVCVVSVHKMGAGFEQGSVFHVQGDLVDYDHLSSCADLLMTTSPNVMVYAAIDGWRRHMVRSGTKLLDQALGLARTVRNQVDELPGLCVMEKQLLRKEASHDLDRLQVLVDVSELGVSGYQVADWLRTSHAIDVGLSDHRRVLATLSMADDVLTTDRLLLAFEELTKAAGSFEAPVPVQLPAPGDLELETPVLPRTAFFGPKESVTASDAVGRVSAEQVTPYPPGVPTLVPGERITQPVVDYLRSGVAAGMVIPDATDASLETFLVVV